MTRRSQPPTFTPRASRQARFLLADIGLPEKTPFVPDRFQTEAVRLIRRSDVLVSAPTGSGKTWIAEEAMARVLEQGGRAWYASPLKALSNAKLLEFSDRFGGDQVGILTGDRKENPEAPIVVGTTEILRNQLYDAMAEGHEMRFDLVVLDEAHYLADPDRGVVWEETIIYLPSRINLLLLSATMANDRELADWIFSIRNKVCRVVVSSERPVPLKPLFLAPDGEIWPLTTAGRLNKRISHLLKRPRALNRAIPHGRTLKALETLDLLPAIFFLTSRADCDKALTYCRQNPTGRWAENRGAREKLINLFLTENPYLRDNQFISLINRYGVASHHAGHLPQFKLLIEKLMQAGLLRAIFATSTVAAGVNFPARSVILPQSDRFNGRNFQSLSATELTQMTGRAGRRGMDRVGFAVLPPGPHQDLPLMAGLLNAPPEPIRSRMHLSFSMILNLLMSHRPEDIDHLLGSSLAAFQSTQEDEPEPPEFLRDLAKTLESGRCRGLEEALVVRSREARTRSDLAYLESKLEDLETSLRLADMLVPGRIFLDFRGRPWMVRKTTHRKGRPGVLAVRLTPKLKLKHGRFRLKFKSFESVSEVIGRVVEDGPDPKLISTLRRLANKRLRPLERLPELSPRARAELDNHRNRLAEVRETARNSPCLDCDLSQECWAEPLSEMGRDLNRAEDWFDRLAAEKKRLWLEFVARLEFLKSSGFVTENGRLTDKGQWAAGLRLDHPLVIAEAIQTGGLDRATPQVLAGLMAPFVLDRTRAWSSGERRSRAPRDMRSAYFRLEKKLTPFIRSQFEAGFEGPKFRFAPALAMYLWATGRPWQEVIDRFGVEPGDMSSLVYRTADNLRQIISLHETHGELSNLAARARSAIRRQPFVE